MEYHNVMEILSQCGLGALLLSNNGTIISVNESGDRLLHGEGDLLGKKLCDISSVLCSRTEKPIYTNIAFGEYLMRCPSPEIKDLPENSEIVVFRDATGDACHDMLMNILNQINESVVL